MSTATHITLRQIERYWIHRLGDKLLLWVYAKLFAVMLALFLCFPKQQRMSHNNGIGAAGKLRIVDNPEFPAHPFFAPGREFPVRIRHASATFLDDARNRIHLSKLCAKGCDGRSYFYVCRSPETINHFRIS